MKKVIAILLIAVMALSFAACAKKAVDPIVGTWKADFSEMFNALSEEDRAMMESFGFTLDSLKFEITFNEDGTGHSEMDMYGEQESADFTYTAADGKLTMNATVDGETNVSTSDYEIVGDKMTVTSEGETMTFNRK